MISDVRCEQVEFELRWVFTADETLLEKIYNKIKMQVEEYLWELQRSHFLCSIPSQGEYTENHAWGFLDGLDELPVEVNLEAGTFTIVVENKREGEDALDYTNHDPSPLAWVDALFAYKKVIS